MPTLHRFAALPDGDPERDRLRSQLVTAFLPVVEHIAVRYTGLHAVARDDLIQTGAAALITAIDRWDPEQARGEFLGYLVPCVRGEILRYFRDRTWSTRVPRRLKDLSVAISKATGPLTQQLSRAPRPSELAAHLGIPVDDVIDALAAKTEQHAAPLYPADDDSGPVRDTLGTIDTAFAKIENREALRPLIAALPERQRRILLLRFFHDRTQSQIAAEIGISQMHVSRLLARTLRTLRHGLDNVQPEPTTP